MQDSDASSSELLDTMVADKINDYREQPHLDIGLTHFGQHVLSAKFKKPPSKPPSQFAQLKAVLGAVLGESNRR